MDQIIEVDINGKTVYFEQSDDDGETEKVGGFNKLGAKMGNTFEQALDTIDVIVSSAAQRIRAFDKKIAPDEFQIEFGVKLSGEYGAVVSKIAGEAQVIVTVTYKHTTS